MDWPQFSSEDLRAFGSLSYPELAAEVMRPFLGDTITRDVFDNLVEATYRQFTHPLVAPLKQFESNIWLMELFHGPTLAFKDYAMQILGRLFDQALLARGKRTTIVGATSGTRLSCYRGVQRPGSHRCFYFLSKGSCVSFSKGK